jgi:hypothetical protein
MTESAENLQPELKVGEKQQPSVQRDDAKAESASPASEAKRE